MSDAILSEEKLPGDSNNNNDQSDDTSQSGMEGSNICRDYQRGVCNRGGKCKFSHPEGLGKEVESSPMICRDFQNGKCNRSTCKYMHISIVEEKMYLRTGQMPPARRPMPPMHGGPPPMRGGFGGGYPTRANRSDPVCKDFLNSKCTRGASCKYRHAYEDDYGYSGGYDDFPRKRRRESFGDGDFAHVKEENESLRRQVADLQKQVSDLKATNEVLLEQNARYRNAAANSTSYPTTPSYPSSYTSKPSASASAPTSYSSTSYPSTYNGSSSTTYPTTTSYTSYSADSAVYTSTSNYGASTSDSTAYSSNYPTGSGYIKFE